MYEKKISRQYPGLIVCILDKSGSTQDSLPGTSDPIYIWEDRLFGISLQELLCRSTDIQGDTAVIKSRYFTSIIQYGNYPVVWGDAIMNIEETVEKYTNEGNSIGCKGDLGGTDTEGAFKKAYGILEKAVEDKRFKDSFPPMLIHMTDGKSHTDSTQIVEKIKKLSTADGNVLVLNSFIGTQTNLQYSSPEDFPGYVTEDEAGPSPDNKLLFNMSSEIPQTIHQNLVEDGIFPKLRKNARLFFDVRSKEQLKHVFQVTGSIGSRAQR